MYSPAVSIQEKKGEFVVVLNWGEKTLEIGSSHSYAGALNVAMSFGLIVSNNISWLAVSNPQPVHSSSIPQPIQAVNVHQSASDEKTCDAKEIAEYLGVSKDTVYRLVRENKIPHIRIQSTILFRLASVTKWLAEQERQNYQSE